MTNTPQVGDRITLTGTVAVGPDREGDIWVRFDGDGGGIRPYITAAALAHAKIEPRPLAVGDRVRATPGGSVFTILAIDDGIAWIKLNAISRSHCPLSHLTRADQST